MEFPELRKPIVQEFGAILNCLNYEYVVIGGAACLFHGSRRTTYDCDIVIKNSENIYAFFMSFLQTIQQCVGPHNFYHLQNKNFYFKGFWIDLIPSNYSGDLFEVTRYFLWKDGVRVLSRHALLKAKLVSLASVQERATAGKDVTDAEDAIFLFRQLTEPFQSGIHRDFHVDTGFNNLLGIINTYPGFNQYAGWINHMRYIIYGWRY